MVVWTKTNKATSFQFVTNGSFTGNANGWTLGNGWSYGTNNVLYTLLGSELVTNGSFAGNANGWTLANTVSYNSNNILFGNNVSLNPQAFQTFTITAGQAYRIAFDYVTSVSGIMTVQLATGGTGGGFTINRFLNTTLAGSATSSTDFTATATPASPGIRFLTSSPQWQGTVTNVTTKPINQGTLSQVVPTASGIYYLVSGTVSGTTGSVTLSFGNSTLSIAAGTTQTAFMSADNTGLISISASTNFNGSVSNVSVTSAFYHQNKNIGVFTKETKN